MKTVFLLFSLVFIQCTQHSQTVPPVIDLQSFATGFSLPLEITHCGDSRLFVVEQDGLIKILNSNGTTNATPFLNLSSLTNAGGEQGLLGLAFHPNYASNGYFYVNYTKASDGATVIARYSVSAENPNVANPTGSILLTIPQPYSNHNGGTLKFGPDGYLYIGMGDGGSGGDPGNRAQNIDDLLGKMLRIDVNSGSPYGIPPGNPYASVAGADEIWALGLRNPWKFSFDRQNGDLWIADVGQNLHEEVNRAGSSEAGLNYGWRCYEGNSAYNTSGCAPQATYKTPLIVTDHSSGFCSITGGYVYRGTSYPGFQGKYFFSDYCKPQICMADASGNVFFSQTFSGNSFVTFGEDVNGELYVGSINNGVIYKLVDTTVMSVTKNNKKSFTIYPNPAKSQIFIRSNDESTYMTHAEILDFNGKKLISHRAEKMPQHSIETENLAIGLYLLKVFTNSGLVSTYKFSKK